MKNILTFMFIILLIIFFTIIIIFPCYAGGFSKSATASGEVIKGHIEMQGAILWKGTDGDAVTIYDGTGSSRHTMFKFGGGSRAQHSIVNFDTLEFYDSIYCETTWTGTGVGDPTLYIILK